MKRRSGIAFASGLGLLAFPELLAKLLEYRSFFAQGGFDAGDLPVEEVLAARDHDGAGLTPDLFLGPVSANPFEPGIRK